MKKEYIETAYELLRLRMFALCLIKHFKQLKEKEKDGLPIKIQDMEFPAQFAYPILEAMQKYVNDIEKELEKL